MLQGFFQFFLYRIDLFTVLSTLDMDKLVKLCQHHWIERLNFCKTAKFESDSRPHHVFVIVHAEMHHFWKKLFLSFFNFLSSTNSYVHIRLSGKLEKIFLEISLSQWYGHPRVLGIPISKTLVIWASHVTLTLRGCPYHQGFGYGDDRNGGGIHHCNITFGFRQ